MNEIQISEHSGLGNQIPNSRLGPIDIEIVGAKFVIKGTPNTIIKWALEGLLGAGPGFSDTDPDLGEAGDVFLYRTDQVALKLPREKMVALLFRDLSPEDFFILHARFGIFHEIHDDFYDPETGEALQPI